MFIDIFLVIVLCWAVINGWRNGFMREIVSGIGWLLGLFVAAACYHYLGDYLTVSGSTLNMTTSIVAFLILWIVVPIALGLAAGFLHKVFKMLYLGMFDGLAGAFVSVLKFVVLLSCAFNVMEYLNIMNQTQTASSKLYVPTRDALSIAFENMGEGHQSVKETQTFQNDTIWVDMNTEQKPENKQK